MWQNPWPHQVDLAGVVKSPSLGGLCKVTALAWGPCHGAHLLDTQTKVGLSQAARHLAGPGLGCLLAGAGAPEPQIE